MESCFQDTLKEKLKARDEYRIFRPEYIDERTKESNGGGGSV